MSAAHAVHLLPASLLHSLLQTPEIRRIFTDSGELISRWTLADSGGSKGSKKLGIPEVLTPFVKSDMLNSTPGGVAEWSIAPVLKTGGPARVP